MKKLLEKHPDTLIVILAFLFATLLVIYFVLGVRSVTRGLQAATELPIPEEGGVVYDFVKAEALMGRQEPIVSGEDADDEESPENTPIDEGDGITP